jgi:CDP-glucose 4,6-dehydratase
VGTIETNVLGTVHLLDALRSVHGLSAALVITSDKVYENSGTDIAFSETAPLGGDDPYSASKAAAELVTHAYARSFFADGRTMVCTARAGNVIGGGDWAAGRIIPDLWRGYSNGETVDLRYPDAVRPWQHVLDPLYGYLLFLEQMVEAPRSAAPALNFAPPATDPILTVRQLAEKFSEVLGADELFQAGHGARLPESARLAIDASQAAASIGWRTLLPLDEALRWTCEWYKAFQQGLSMRHFSIRQIEAYLALARVGAADALAIPKTRSDRPLHRSSN